MRGPVRLSRCRGRKRIPPQHERGRQVRNQKRSDQGLNDLEIWPVVPACPRIGQAHLQQQENLQLRKLLLEEASNAAP